MDINNLRQSSTEFQNQISGFGLANSEPYTRTSCHVRAARVIKSGYDPSCTPAPTCPSPIRLAPTEVSIRLTDRFRDPKRSGAAVAPTGRHGPKNEPASREVLGVRRVATIRTLRLPLRASVR